MRNFFFFRHTIKANEQGQMRHELEAMPGQVTYDPATRGLVPVSTTRKVQCSSAMRRKVCESHLGTVFGICLTGSTPLSASLKTYTRNDISFYRVDAAVNLDTECDETEDIMRAFNSLIIIIGGGSRDLVPAGTQEAAPAQETHDDPVPAPTMQGLCATAPLMRRVVTGPAAAQMTHDDIVTLSQFFDRAAAGVVCFAYIKNGDGSRRQAIGTRNANVIRTLSAVQGARDNGQEATFDGVHCYYYDIERGAWRCFTAENILYVGRFIPASDQDAIAEAALRCGAAVA